MPRKFIDCRDYPSASKCTLTIAGEEDEVVRTSILARTAGSTICGAACR